MKHSEIITIIESIAPLAAQAPWDASGVQVAALRDDITHMSVLLDPTLRGIAAAVEEGADFILAHHPLSMKPCFPNRRDEYLAVLSTLFTKNVWMYSAHTSLDAAPDGPVRWLSVALGLNDVTILEETVRKDTDGVAYGFGFVGDFPTAVPYGEFRQTLARSIGRDSWQACGPVCDTVRRVACCPGAGGSVMQAAVTAGADVFITGDFKYHSALDALSIGLRVLDVGHFVLEEEMMRRFAQLLAGRVSVNVTFIPGCEPFSLEYAGESI